MNEKFEILLNYFSLKQLKRKYDWKTWDTLDCPIISIIEADGKELFNKSGNIRPFLITDPEYHINDSDGKIFSYYNTLGLGLKFND